MTVIQRTRALFNRGGLLCYEREVFDKTIKLISKLLSLFLRNLFFQTNIQTARIANSRKLLRLWITLQCPSSVKRLGLRKLFEEELVVSIVCLHF